MEAKYILVIVGVFAVCATAEDLNGPCPTNHKIKEKVDWILMANRWFTIKQSNPNKVPDAKCAQSDVSFALPYLNFTLVRYLPSNRVYEKVQGNGVVRDAGRLNMFLQKKDGNWNDVLFEVLDTDYYNFALIYYCHNNGPFSSYYGTYVLSRTSDIDNGLYMRMDNILQQNGLNTTDTLYKDTQDCGKIVCDTDYTHCKIPAV